jgi:hypothetical protein
MITSTVTHASHSELQGHLLMRERRIGLMLLRVLQLLWCREKRKLRHFHKTIRYASRQVGMPITCRVAPPTFPFAQTRVHTVVFHQICATVKWGCREMEH